ncbi:MULTISPECIES: questin oxidase family protein [unclassified Streptomyces]|uniref:questin oxidase family protein n=1 Tax=unclassified Streptomyces TaxID=2593676 RepID=UPI0001C1A853|nr:MULTISPECIES: questin oxidase family protein [unclassified Streptomyces]AEN14114.1 conserved hypothetical protein [Streptomyces sp. SirexAA-E]MYR66860.1 DUF4243 domain-containing protein [Streptomyces sp. SID4939]MYS03654.1 DUF4243 domain-containing protein [Streptomyces sp. SID4940]MYT66074.1 DUF4243 domain-containing protein [Streptomyces sp. SID8357]MYT88850.1 DUF4243 domain-containing protein [Streptomyces sp. SID8360]
MAAPTYNDAMAEALERLSTVGYEHGTRTLVNHAPMAAEALAHMGYTEAVSPWLDRTLTRHVYHEAPEPRWRLSPDDPAEWRAALGDFSRVGDWTALFARRLEEEPWRDVLALWWPRLIPGVLSMLGHGVIRTAHAVRALERAGEEDRLQRGELAHGLGYWAARYQAGPDATGGAATEEAGDAMEALDRLTADNAGVYATARPRFPVPLVHAVTTPAAVRLVSAYVPARQRWPSYLATAEATRVMRSTFAAGSAITRPEPPADAPSAAEAFATAVEIGDEHAIKLAEVAVRLDSRAPDHRYAAASHTANRAIARFRR